MFCFDSHNPNQVKLLNFKLFPIDASHPNFVKNSLGFSILNVLFISQLIGTQTSVLRFSRNLSNFKTVQKLSISKSYLRSVLRTLPASLFVVLLKTLDKKILKYSNLNCFMILRFLSRILKPDTNLPVRN